jgi:hypothetical protein
MNSTTAMIVQSSVKIDTLNHVLSVIIHSDSGFSRAGQEKVNLNIQEKQCQIYASAGGFCLTY